MGIVMPMRFDFVLATRGLQAADIEDAAARAVMHVAIELAGLELEWSGHIGMVCAPARMGERGPTNSARRRMNGRFRGMRGMWDGATEPAFRGRRQPCREGYV